MDVTERLTLEAAQADTMLASEHRHRYEFAAPLCSGLRVLDLCCGSGYGSAILAREAQHVVGVDVDAATVDTAQVTVGRGPENVEFAAADAIAYLEGDVDDRFDVIVCFEGLEHLPEYARAVALLCEHARRGVKLVISLPNSKMLGEANPYHYIALDYAELTGLFAPLPDTIIVPQFLAEGSLICPEGATETDVRIDLRDHREPEYANHLIFCVGFDAAAVAGAHHGRMQLNASPVFNRWAENLKRGAAALRRENARLGRAQLGMSGSAAPTALARLAQRDAEVAGLNERLRLAEARAAELDATMAELSATPLIADAQVSASPVSDGPAAGMTGAVEARPVEIAPGEDPNSWEQRRRRAAQALIPWIEQTVTLAGATVLEYGCGNAPVSCALAQRGARVIGVDIDPDGLALGRRELDARGIENVELELHPAETIRDAVASRRGQVDVFLLYAVLEHLEIEERLAVLRLAREVVKADGVIVVCESPNRLIYFDHHTAQMPFFHLLEPELALRYRHRSRRAVITAALDEAAEISHEAALAQLAALGRGVSFHEFELVFDDLSAHVIASNYDPVLFGERPIHPDEVILWRYLARWRPDLAPVWSRYWLDLILTPQPTVRRPPFIRPWTADTDQSEAVGWTAWENLHLKGSGSTLWVTLPRPTSRLVVGTITQDGRWLTLQARPAGGPSLGARHTAPARVNAFTTFKLPTPASRIALSASDACHVVFVGYEE